MKAANDLPRTVCFVAILGFSIATTAFGAGPGPYVHTRSPEPISFGSMTLAGAVVPNGEPTVAWFEWGTNAFAHATPAVELGSGSTVMQARYELHGLERQAIYQCRLVASNASGVCHGAPRFFTTGRGVWVEKYAPVPPGLGSIVAIDSEGGASVVLRADRTVAVLDGMGLISSGDFAAGVVRVAAGGGHVLLLLPDGKVLGKGESSYGQILTAPLTSVVDIAAAANHSLFLRSNGTVTALGQISGANVQPPPNLSNVVEVAAGEKHCLALRADGVVVGWGVNTYGQIKIPVWLTNVVAVAAGANHSLALCQNGTVVSWGLNTSGETNTPPDLSGAVAINAFGAQSCAIRSNLSVTFWGTRKGTLSGVTNVLAIGSDGQRLVGIANVPPVGRDFEVRGPANNDLVIALQNADPGQEWLYYTVTALPERGQLFQCVNGVRGAQINAPGTAVEDWQGRMVFVPEPDAYGNAYASFRVVGTDPDFGAVESTVTVSIDGAPLAFTDERFVALSSGTTVKGTVNCNGFPTHYWFEWQPLGGSLQQTATQLLATGSSLTRVSAGFPALTGPSVCVYRLVASNHIGVSYGNKRFAGFSTRLISLGAIPNEFQSATALAAGWTFGMALGMDGALTTWGALAANTIPASLTNAVAITAGTDHAVAVRAGGTVVAWGAPAIWTAPPPGLTNVVDVAAGQRHTVAALADGSVTCWGSNQFHQLLPPGGLANVVQVSAGTYHTLALLSDGTVIGWGSNKYHQSEAPPDATDVISVEAGGYTSIAVRRDGTIIVWGHTTRTNLAPSALGGRPVSVKTAGTATYVVLEDGRLITFGGTVPASAPEVFSVSAGGSQMFALSVAPVLPGAIVQPPAWRAGDQAILRGLVFPRGTATEAWFEWSTNGTEWAALPASPLGAGTNAVEISAPAPQLPLNRPMVYRLAAANSSGVVRGNWQATGLGEKLAVWGRADNAHLPIGLGEQRIAGVAAGIEFGAALRSDGTMFQWGNSQRWLPGGDTLANITSVSCTESRTTVLPEDGTARSTLTQVPPPVLTNLAVVTSGRLHALAVRRDGTVMAWGGAGYGAGAVPAGLTDAAAVAAGWYQSLVLRENGKLVYFGWDSWQSAQTAAALSNVVAIASGDSHCLALHSNGTVSAFGANGSGQCNVPETVTNVVAVAAGAYHSLALRGDGTLVSWGDANSGQAGFTYGNARFATVSGGRTCTVVAGGNVPAIAENQTNSVYPTAQVVIRLPAWDPNADLLTTRILSLPQRGALYQYAEGARGPLISQPGVPVNDPLHRVIFVPDPNELGSSYASFAYAGAEPGQSDQTGTVFLSVIAPPAPTMISAQPQTTGQGFRITFNGASNAVYRIWASTNLVDWRVLGTATPTEPGNTFEFIDPNAAGAPVQFYKSGAP